MVEKPKSSDLQIYQLLIAAKDTSHFNLLPELIQIITENAVKITECLQCYKKYGHCVTDPETLLAFIDDHVIYGMSNPSLADIVQICLSYRKQSLKDITTTPMGHNVFHILFTGQKYTSTPLDCVRILRCIAGKDTWDMISTKDKLGNTALHWADHQEVAHALLEAAPCPEKIWELACNRNILGNSVLMNVIARLNKVRFHDNDNSVIKALLACAPSRQAVWELIDDEMLQLAANTGDGEIVELLESYRPQEH